MAKSEAPQAKVKRILGRMRKPATPFQQKMGAAMERVNYLKTRHAVINKDPKFDSVRNVISKQTRLDEISAEIKRTLGEAMGVLHPLER